jgi:hypothetical protein
VCLCPETTLQKLLQKSGLPHRIYARHKPTNFLIRDGFRRTQEFRISPYFAASYAGFLFHSAAQAI